MEMRQLRYFVEAARLGHFTRAAERLRVAQPSLSQQIRGLETELGVRLFDRSGRRVILTEAGQALLVRAERILAEAGRAKAEAGEFSGLLRGRVMVGALQSLVEVRLPGLLTAFSRLHPGVEVALREETTAQMLWLLKEGELDLALGHTTGIRTPSRVVAEQLFHEGLVLVVSPEHALAGRNKEVRLKELKDETFVSYKEGSGIRAALVKACRDEGFEPRISFECGTPRSLAAAGLGVAVVPRSMAESPGSPVAVVELKPSLARTVAVFGIEGRYLSPAAEAFLGFAKARLSKSVATDLR
jgi:DNA-binding transcriptional LysR family regulator